MSKAFVVERTANWAGVTRVSRETSEQRCESLLRDFIDMGRLRDIDVEIREVAGAPTIVGVRTFVCVFVL